MKPLPKLSPEPDRRSAETRYLDLLTSVMSQKMGADWKTEATDIARLLKQDGLLDVTPPLNQKEEFLADAISENPAMLDNSNLRNLMAARYRPEHAQTATEIATLLLLSVSD